MTRLRTAAAIVGVTALVAGVVMMVSGAFAASSTLSLNAGDSAHVACAGPSLQVANQTATALDLNCAANPTTTTAPPTSGVLLGNTAVEPTSDTSSAPASEAFGFTASQSGTATSASVYLTSTGGVHAALYSDSSGRPGNLLDQGQVASNTAGWAQIPLPGGVQVAAGARYWVALGAVTGGSVTYRDVGSSGSNLDFSGTGFASPYASNGQWNSNPVSAYVSGTTSSGGTTTTAAPQTTTTTVPSGGGTCINPVFSTSDPQGKWYNGADYVNNNAWNGSAGPQTLYACSLSSWYVQSNQPNNGGAVETYPSVCGCNGWSPTPIVSHSSIPSSFGENIAHQGIWDAAYDTWTDDWANEIMIQNDVNGHPSGADQGLPSTTIDGVTYYYGRSGTFIYFIRGTYVASGTIDLVPFYQFLDSIGWAKSTDTMTAVGYGVEISATESAPGVPGQQRFDITNYSLTPS